MTENIKSIIHITIIKILNNILTLETEKGYGRNKFQNLSVGFLTLVKTGPILWAKSISN